jgi:uncharacterized protein
MFPIGAEVGFSSSGAGALGTVALLGMTNLTAAQVVGTDLAFGLVVTIVGTCVHIFGGDYAQALLVKMALGGVAGGIMGMYVAPKIPNRTLRLVLAFWLAIVGLQFCYQAVNCRAESAAMLRVPAHRKQPPLRLGVSAQSGQYVTNSFRSMPR